MILIHLAADGEDLSDFNFLNSSKRSKIAQFFHHSNQHHLKTRPGHRSLATSQTSELVGKAPKTCNSYPDAIFKWHH